jgi:type IV secretion system protein VirB9
VTAVSATPSAALGRLAPKAHVVLLTTAVLLVTGVTFAAEAADPRLRIVDYRSTLVLPLTLFVGYHIHLEFAPDEYFVNLGAGDTSALDVGAEGNHLLLKPKQANAGSNLTILTNRRTYFVDYRALARPPRGDEAIYSIVFRYPEAGTAVAAASNDPMAADGQLDAPRPSLNKDYWYRGSPSLRPTAAVDDGLQLRLTFDPHAALPAVFAREPDGEEVLVNSHVEGDVVVVHRLAARLVLRRGHDVGCVVDHSSRLRDRRAENGTIDARVDRTTRDVPR